MARQLYFRGQAPEIALKAPATTRVLGKPQGYDIGGQLIEALGNTGRVLVGAMEGIRQSKQQGQMTDAELELQRRMTEWQAEYQRTHQGANALDAQRDFTSQFENISKDIFERYDDQLDDSAKVALRRRFALHGIHTAKNGAQYQAQEFRAWGANQEKVQLAQFDADIASDPNDFDWHMNTVNRLVADWQRRNPGMDSTAYRLQLQEGMAQGIVSNLIARGDIAGAEAALQRFGGGAQTGGSVQVRPGIGNTTAQYESGSDGINAIGYDKNGGTSYGKWQLSSRQGSFNEWLDHLATKGEAGANAARAIRAAGEANTGSRKGAAVDAYKKEAAANPELFETSQREYIQAKHYGPMLQKLSPEQRNQIEANPALQEMAWSTAVQHGGAGGARILNRIWKPGMSDADMVNATYSARGGNFGSSTTEVQDAVKARFQGERGVILGMLNGRQQPRAADASPSYNGGVISPAKAMALHRHIQAAKDLQQKEAARTTAQGILSETASLPPEQQKAQAYALMGQLPQDVRGHVKTLVDSGLKFREDALDAQYGATMANYLTLAPKLSPMEREQTIDRLVQEGKLSREKGDKLRTWNEKDASRLTPERERTFANLLDAGNRNIALGVEGAMTDTSDIDREFANGNLTPKQREDLIKIRRNAGALKNFDKPHLDNLYSKFLGKKNKEMPAELYSRLVQKAIDAGKPLDDDAINALIAREMTPVSTPGRLWGTNETPLWEAESDGKKVVGVPIPPHLEQTVTDDMKANGFTEAQTQDQKTREQYYANRVYGRK